MQDLTPKLAAAVTIAAVGWLVLVLASPVAVSSGRFSLIALSTYHAGSLVCHQRPERSFHLAGIQMPVCARCLGLYAAGAAGAAVPWVRRRRSDSRNARIVFGLAALPIALTVALEWMNILTPSNTARLLTGLPLGFVAGWILVSILGADSIEPGTARAMPL
jgi:uncharacterized membrane protein